MQKSKDRWDRIFDRATAIEAAKRKVRAEIDARLNGQPMAYAGRSYKAVWDERIARLMEEGMTKPQAAKHLAEVDPHLREMMVEEANQGRR